MIVTAGHKSTGPHSRQAGCGSNDFAGSQGPPPHQFQQAESSAWDLRTAIIEETHDR